MIVSLIRKALRGNKKTLRATLDLIKDLDPSYAQNSVDRNEEQALYRARQELTIQAISLALGLGYKAGFMVHDPIEDLMPSDELGFMVPPKWDPRWGVVAYIELPAGQVSWHLDDLGTKYDGHTVEEKYKRIDEFNKNY